jgi:hypothetical protein
MSPGLGSSVLCAPPSRTPLAPSIPLADRVGRRVVRCLELTPLEEIELLQRGGDRVADLLVGLTAKRGGGR